MAISLLPHQVEPVEQLRTGSILRGGVGSGKSITSIYYYFTKECKGVVHTTNNKAFKPMKNPKDLYIITTAKKRDSLEWERDCSHFLLSTDRKCSINNVKVTVDSWNNIGKYKDIKDAFFIFDEQRLVGSGAWVKAFLKIVKVNNWILLTATPGDTWMDYIPVFIANGFYKNRTEFLRRHVVYSRFSKFPKVDHYIECQHLARLRKQITVVMDYKKPTTSHDEEVLVTYDKDKYDILNKDRWNIFKQKPIKDISELCYSLRRLVNSDSSRTVAIKDLSKKHNKLIVFYNFDYELEILREIGKELNIPFAEWNGHKHETIPKADKWIYFVQYTSGAEGWNCIETNAIAFFSQNYSYKTTLQAAGRIDRLNTPFSDLYYYHVRSKAPIDQAILKALKNKQTFNESKFINNSREKHML